MERVFVCSPMRPSLGDDEARASEAIRRWTEHARTCLAQLEPELPFYLMIAMHERYKIRYASLLEELAIHVVEIDDAIPYEDARADIARAAQAGNAFLDVEVLRKCFACPALMRTRLLTHACGLSKDRPVTSALWFLGLETRDMGTPEQFMTLWDRMKVSVVNCVILPQPDEHDRRAIIVDLPPAEGKDNGRTAIMKVDMMNTLDTEHESAFRYVRAGAVNGFDWALSSLAVFSIYPMMVGQMPVTTAWLTGARAAASTRAGEDYAWFWAACDGKKVSIEALVR